MSPDGLASRTSSLWTSFAWYYLMLGGGRIVGKQSQLYIHTNVGTFGWIACKQWYAYIGSIWENWMCGSPEQVPFSWSSLDVMRPRKPNSRVWTAVSSHSNFHVTVVPRDWMAEASIVLLCLRNTISTGVKSYFMQFLLTSGISIFYPIDMLV